MYYLFSVVSTGIRKVMMALRLVADVNLPLPKKVLYWKKQHITFNPDLQHL